MTTQASHPSVQLTQAFMPPVQVLVTFNAIAPEQRDLTGALATRVQETGDRRRVVGFRQSTLLRCSKCLHVWILPSFVAHSLVPCSHAPWYRTVLYRASFSAALSWSPERKGQAEELRQGTESTLLRCSECCMCGHVCHHSDSLMAIRCIDRRKRRCILVV